MTFWTGKTVVVVGGTGFLGQRLTHFLKATDAHLVVPAGTQHLDLRKPESFRNYCIEYGLRPHIVFHLAARVAGIGATSQYPVEFLYDNTMMGLNLLRDCYDLFVDKVVVAGSVCAYPENTPIPMHETALWDGYPEPTNAAYGLAKRTVLAAQLAYEQEYDFETNHILMANLYGPGQSNDPSKSHVIPAIIAKIAAAMARGEDVVELWGTGNVSRDFLYVDDAARAFIRIAEHRHRADPVNIGSGIETSILSLAHLLADLMGYTGRFLWDASKPDGQARRCLNIGRVAGDVGWKPTTDLRDGLIATVRGELAR